MGAGDALPSALAVAESGGVAVAGADAVWACVGSALLLGSCVPEAVWVNEGEPLLLPESSRHVALLEAPRAKE